MWFDVLSFEGVHATSSYVSRDGKIVSAQCGNLIVRPTGENSTYPPTATSGLPSGYSMTIDLEEEGILVAEAENESTIFEIGGYTRWRGSFSGTLNGKRLPKGFALYEEANNLVGND